MQAQIVGLDLGRRNIKAYDGSTYLTFQSFVGEYRDLRLDYKLDSKGFITSFNNTMHFVGSVAKDESEFARQMLVDNKTNPDTLILALTTLHQLIPKEADEGVFDVVTGLPVSLYTKENKDSLSSLLTGEWVVTVNGVAKKIRLERVRVSVEGGGAFWSNPRAGLVRIIDGGSKTINYISLRNKRYIDKDSDTLPFGFDTNRSLNLQNIVSVIAGEVGKKWSAYDDVFTVGGMAKPLAENLKPFFPKVAPLELGQRLSSDGGVVDGNLFSNAIGYFNIGRSV